MTLEADPRELRLTPDREDGPDPFRLSDQVRDFGGSVEGMPALLEPVMNFERLIRERLTPE